MARDRTGGAVPLVPGALRSHRDPLGVSPSVAWSAPSAVQPDPRLSVVAARLGLKEMTDRAKAVIAVTQYSGLAQGHGLYMWKKINPLQ